MLRKSLREIVRHGSVYMLSWFINAALSLSLLPVYTRYLNKTEYGTLAMLDSGIGLIRIVFALGLAPAIIRFYHETTDDGQRKKVMSTGILVVLAIAIISSLVLYLFRNALTIAVLGKSGSVIYFLLGAATMVVGLIRSGSDAYLMAKKASMLFLLANSGHAFVNALLNLYLLIVKGMGVTGMLTGNLISAILINCLLLFIVFKDISICIDLSILRKMLRFGTPIALSMLAAAGMHELDRFFIRHYTSMASVGLYALAYQFPFMLNTMFSQGFERIWSGSTMYEIAKSSNAKYQYKRIATYYMTVLGFALFCISVAAKTIVAIFAAPEYASAAKYIPVISFGVWLYSLHIFLKVGVLLTKKTYLFSINYSIALIINIVANFLLVPYWGAMGAAIATVITYGFFSLGGFYLYRVHYPLEFEWIRLATIALISIVLVCLRYVINIHNFGAGLLVDMAAILLFPAILLLLPGFLTKGERDYLAKFTHIGFTRICELIR